MSVSKDSTTIRQSDTELRKEKLKIQQLRKVLLGKIKVSLQL